MEKYNEYKDSGIEWLGEIPEHWEVKRIKDCASKVKTGTTPSSKDGDYFSEGTENWFTPVDIKNNVINFSSRKVIKKSFTDNQISLFDEHSIYLIGIGGTLGNVAISTAKSSCNQQINVITFSKDNIDSKFSFYQLIVVGNTLLGWCNYTTMPIFTQTATKQLELALPPLREQTQIADFLDVKTTAIDKKVKLLQQKVKLYKAYRKNLINEAITKGLDKTVNLKDSGIDWLGVIPKHWEVKRLKDVGKAIIGIVYSPSDIVNEKEGILVLRSSNIQNDKPSFLNNVYVNKEIPNHHLTKVGDILICSRNGSRRLIGKNIVIDDKTKDYTFGAFMTILRSKNYRFLSYFFKSILFDFQSGVFMTSTINQLTVSTLNKLYFAFPPIEEQIQIADYLDTKITSIDKIVKNIETQITTLKELRKTLINEVVTGKVKVSA
ncbi:type I restriction enzyme, S subunit [Algibacter lectus]|uniref:restriction endonuclease subunit S n=1 Tax=Algibacter lectus TaxID=221126 RepID=UPI0008DEEE6E|nr:restriction endonuclease subunit S [Algibacter lectus]SFB92299.1 type I restriction enzyme, S subunit [Algibacter lectus]